MTKLFLLGRIVGALMPYSKAWRKLRYGRLGAYMGITWEIEQRACIALEYFIETPDFHQSYNDEMNYIFFA